MYSWETICLQIQIDIPKLYVKDGSEMYFKNDFVFKKLKNYKYRKPLKEALTNSFIKSNLLQVIFSLPADSLILPGTASGYRILISAFFEVKKRKKKCRGKPIHSTDLAALFSHYLRSCKQSWEASRTHYSKPDGLDGSTVVWLFHRGASEAV